MSYVNAVVEAGGVPVVLPPIEKPTSDILSKFDGFILSGGDDPQMEPYGIATHPKATPVLIERQSYETALLDYFNDSPDTPLLCICLGMQMLALSRGGTLNQHLPDTHPESHEIHWGQIHDIKSVNETTLASGNVWSSHRQAIDDAGDLRVLARSSDGVIEAIDDPSRAFTLAVQWHPERTENEPLGADLFKQLILASM